VLQVIVVISHDWFCLLFRWFLLALACSVRERSVGNCSNSGDTDIHEGQNRYPFVRSSIGPPPCHMAVAVVRDRLRMDKIRGRVTDSEPDGRALPGGD
jgi:hypothetical protein